MYGIPKTGDTILITGTIMAIVSQTLLIIIIAGVCLTFLSLLSKRVAIEPVHRDDGYRWAVTKNGKPFLWLAKKSNDQK